MSEFRTSIDIAADPDTVFDFLVTNDGMTAWMGQYADLDPREGGRFAVDVSGQPIRGQYLIVDRPHRVVVSWGMPGVDNLPAGSSRVSFTLSAIPGGTRVQLDHTDLPEAQVPGHNEGWAHYLPRLELVATGRSAGVDEWEKTAHPQPGGTP